MREFGAMYRSTRQALRPLFTEDEIDMLRDKSERAYLDLFPELPYVGGNKSTSTINIIMGAIVLSMVRPLEDTPLTKHQIGKTIFETFEGYFRAKPRLIQRLIGKLVTSSIGARRLKKQIEKSSQRLYEDDFVTEYVDPAGKDFEFGYDYTECALHRFFAKHDAAEYLRYICLGDYALFRSLSIGFFRTQVLSKNNIPYSGNLPYGFNTPFVVLSIY